MKKIKKIKIKSRMVLAAPGPLLTPPPSSSPPKTPFRSYSAQIRSPSARRAGRERHDVESDDDEGG
jgi:hypothetical protein